MKNHLLLVFGVVHGILGASMASDLDQGDRGVPVSSVNSDPIELEEIDPDLQKILERYDETVESVKQESESYRQMFHEINAFLMGLGLGNAPGFRIVQGHEEQIKKELIDIIQKNHGLAAVDGSISKEVYEKSLRKWQRDLERKMEDWAAQEASLRMIIDEQQKRIQALEKNKKS